MCLLDSSYTLRIIPMASVKNSQVFGKIEFSFWLGAFGYREMWRLQNYYRMKSACTVSLGESIYEGLTRFGHYTNEDVAGFKMCVRVRNMSFHALYWSPILRNDFFYDHESQVENHFLDNHLIFIINHLKNTYVDKDFTACRHISIHSLIK